MPTNNIMIDLETLATCPEATILSIAAVKFDPFEDYQALGITVEDLPRLHFLVDLECQSSRAIDDAVVEWWSQQNETIREQVFAETGRISLIDALNQLHSFVWNSDRVWAQGTQFDISILEHAFRSIDRAYPWQYWQARDSRTLLDLVQVKQPPLTHDALDDCWRQIIGVQQALTTLGIQKFVR